MADCLANKAFTELEKQIFSTFTELPIVARHILNNDKSQISYLRIRTKEIIRA